MVLFNTTVTEIKCDFTADDLFCKFFDGAGNKVGDDDVTLLDIKGDFQLKKVPREDHFSIIFPHGDKCHIPQKTQIVCR